MLILQVKSYLCLAQYNQIGQHVRCLFPFSFETALQYEVQARLVWNLKSLCWNLLNAVITSMSHHAWLGSCFVHMDTNQIKPCAFDSKAVEWGMTIRKTSFTSFQGHTRFHKDEDYLRTSAKSDLVMPAQSRGTYLAHLAWLRAWQSSWYLNSCSGMTLLTASFSFCRGSLKRSS